MKTHLPKYALSRHQCSDCGMFFSDTREQCIICGEDVNDPSLEHNKWVVIQCSADRIVVELREASGNWPSGGTIVGEYDHLEEALETASRLQPY